VDDGERARAFPFERYAASAVFFKIMLGFINKRGFRGHLHEN
jgi:hypothetical protein